MTKRSRLWTRLASLAVAGVVLTAPATAQEPATLTLEQALELARHNNPQYLAIRNDAGPAGWAVREAYANFLPRATVGGGMRYEDSGSALFGSFTAEDIGFSTTPAYYFSSYSANVNLSLSGATLFNVAQQRANRRAVGANITASEVALETAVKRSYLTVLRERDNVAMRLSQLERAEEMVTLAESRRSAGVGTPLDVKQAEVNRGRAQVGLLTAEADHAASRLRLLQQLGLEIDSDVRLTTEFPVFEPGWTVESLVQIAMSTHPTLRSLSATASAQRAAARTAWSSYLPTLSMNAGWSGFTRQVGSDAFLIGQQTGRLKSQLENCIERNDLNSRLANPYPPEDCSKYEPTPERLAEIESNVVSSNRAFPFDFDQQPLTLSLYMSVPVFQGFTRQRQIEQASAAAEDVEHQLRGERLRLQADVAAAYLRLRTAYQAVQIEESNRELAQEQLEGARERYRVGLDSFIELKNAETIKSEADQAYLAALYTFHEALADLESGVGQPLGPESR